MSDRITFYVDGYNLYRGIKQEYGRKWLWLDIGGLCADITDSAQQIQAIHYCTAMSKGDAASRKRQEDYWKALRTVPLLKRHLGRFQDIPRYCKAPGCGAMVGRFSEKQTDTRLASLMVADAMADRTDVLALICGDEDLVPPVQVIRSECPDKSVLVCLPPARKCGKLRKASKGNVLNISEQMIRTNQFPDTVPIKGGQVCRPDHWRAKSSK